MDTVDIVKVVEWQNFISGCLESGQRFIHLNETQSNEFRIKKLQIVNALYESERCKVLFTIVNDKTRGTVFIDWNSNNCVAEQIVKHLRELLSIAETDSKAIIEIEFVTLSIANQYWLVKGADDVFKKMVGLPNIFSELSHLSPISILASNLETCPKVLFFAFDAVSNQVRLLQDYRLGLPGQILLIN